MHVIMPFFLQRWLQEHARNFPDVEIENETEDYTIISIAGPKSRDLFQELTNEDVSEKSFKFMENRTLEIAGIPVLALCVSYTGIKKFRLIHNRPNNADDI